MTVFRYGHLRSAPVVVDAGYARSGNRLHSLQPCVISTRQSWRLLDGFLPLRDETVTRHCQLSIELGRKNRSVHCEPCFHMERFLERPGVHTFQTDLDSVLPSRAVGVNAPCTPRLRGLVAASAEGLSGATPSPQFGSDGVYGMRCTTGPEDGEIARTFHRCFQFSPSRAVGVTAPFCRRPCIRAFAAYTQQSWTSGQVQSAWYSPSVIDLLVISRPRGLWASMRHPVLLDR